MHRRGDRSQVPADSGVRTLSAGRPDSCAMPTKTRNSAFPCGFRQVIGTGTSVAQREAIVDEPKKMIRDTSAQDRRIQIAPSRKRWYVMGGIAAAVIVALL